MIQINDTITSNGLPADWQPTHAECFGPDNNGNMQCYQMDLKTGEQKTFPINIKKRNRIGRVKKFIQQLPMWWKMYNHLSPLKRTVCIFSIFKIVIK